MNDTPQPDPPRGDLDVHTGLDGATCAVLARTAQVYATLVDPTFDSARALTHPDVVRELLRLLDDTAPLRARVRADGGPDHPLLAGDDSTAHGAARAALTQVRTHLEVQRRTSKAQRRGSADQRAQRRAQAAARQERQAHVTALDLVAERDVTIANLRATLRDLEEALDAEAQRVEDALAQRQTAREDLTSVPRLASALADALRNEPTLLTVAAAGVAPDPAPIHEWFMPLLEELTNPTRSRAKDAARALAVQMLGGGVEVGGSCALISADDTRILVDVGARPGARTPAQAAPPGLAAALAERPVDAIVLTHAHADHAGWVPAVLRQHPNVPVYASAATADLLPAMWADGARVWQHTAGQAETPFTAQDVSAAVRNVHPVAFHGPVQLGDLSVTLFPAGHILGAAGVCLRDGQHTVVVSGDISGPGQVSVGAAQFPPDAVGADLLVLESTYGASPPTPPRSATVADLIRDVALVVSGGGRVLVPAFALGRAQEIALTIAAQLPHVPVLIDGLARDLTRVYEQHVGPDGQRLQIVGGNVRLVPRGRTSALVQEFTSGVVISTSGMLAAGPVLTWARAVLPDPNSALMIVGYQDPHTPGGKLVQAAAEDGQITLPDRDGSSIPVQVNAKVSVYQLGAHASADELVKAATQVHAAATMLVHGDPNARRTLAARLEARHLHTVDAADRWQAARL